jgi:hypothetical protein
MPGKDGNCSASFRIESEVEENIKTILNEVESGKVESSDREGRVMVVCPLVWKTRLRLQVSL